MAEVFYCGFPALSVLTVAELVQIFASQRVCAIMSSSVRSSPAETTVIRTLSSIRHCSHQNDWRTSPCTGYYDFCPRKFAQKASGTTRISPRGHFVLEKKSRFATLVAWNQLPLYGMRVDGRSSLQLAGV